MNPVVLKNIDAFLITNPTNIRYITGFVGVASEERESYVLLTQDETYLFTNGLYLEQARQLISSFVMPGLFTLSKVAGTRHPSLLKLDSGSLYRVNGAGMTGKIKVVEISRENPLSKKLATILREQKVKRLGFEEADVTVAEFQKLKKELRGVQLVPTKNRIEEMRMIKKDDEIENIRQATKLTDECFDFILDKIRPDVSESEIAWETESFFRTRGAESAFSPIVAFGKHSSQPHYNLARHSLAASQESVLQNQDIVLLDFGARVNGYCSDMTRVVFVGEPKDEWKRAYEVVLSAHQATIDLLRGFHLVKKQGETPSNNITGALLDRSARECIKEAGFPHYPHSLGHGVGLAIHEQPRLSYKNPSAKLRAGMVVTIEPAIYKEGSYGIRIEDLVLLKKDGIEILSKSSRKLIIL